MSIETWIAFAVTSALLLVIPGPTILTVISFSIAHGRSAALSLVAAVCLGDATALALSILGLGAILSASAAMFSLVKMAGAAYLLFLAFRLIRSGLSPVDASDAGNESNEGRKLFLHTWLVTALNPKGIVFFVAFLPQFVDPAGNSAMQLWTLALTFIGLAGVNALGYTLFASSARHFFESQHARRRLDLASGGLLGIAGAWALRAS